MVMHFEEELKQYRIALNSDVMESMIRPGFDYSDLEYFDLTE